MSQNPRSKQDNPCKPKMDLGFDQCFSNSYDEHFMKQFGCLPPFTLLLTDNACQTGNKTVATEMKKFIVDQSETEISELCGNPCSFSNVVIGFPIEGKNDGNSTYGKMYFHSTLKRTYMTEDYPLMSMIGEIGGYTGLLLGVSFLDIYEILKSLYTNTFTNNRAKNVQ